MGRRHTSGAGGAQNAGGIQVDNTTFSAAANLDIVVEPVGTAIFKIAGDAQIESQGDLRFADADSSNWVALQAPATVASNVTFTLPATDGTTRQVLHTDGSGGLSFAATAVDLADQTVSSTTHYPTITTSTSGTLSGVNVSSSKFTFQPSTGTLGLSGNTPSSSTSTGTLVVTGGVGVSGAFYAGGTARFTDATASTSATTGAVTVAGGLGVGAQGRFTGDVFACGNSTGLQSQISAKLDASASPGALLYNCNGCWNGSAIIPVAQRGVYSRYEIVGQTGSWPYFCSQLSLGFGGACNGSCSANFQQYCCTQCACGWVGDIKCFNSSNNYGCAGNIPWIFGCSTGCGTACATNGYMFNISIEAENVCCGAQRGFRYCSVTNTNGDASFCCIGVRNSGYAYNCCGAHPACLQSVCLTTPSAIGNPFSCVSGVKIFGYGRI